MKIRIALLILSFFISSGVHAKTLALKAGHPERYVVQPGDTLWNIAAKFLHEPWRWEALWQANPQIDNPNQLYPGDVLELAWKEEQPYLKQSYDGVVKLSPQLEAKPLQQAIPTIPVAKIKPFLSRTTVLTQEEVMRLPTILDLASGSIAAVTGQRIYATGLTSVPGVNRFMIMAPGVIYRDPATKAILGYSLTYQGEAELEQAGEPATLRIVKAEREIMPEQFLMPAETALNDLSIVPKLPRYPIAGQIIDLLASNVQVTGKNNSVVINKGRQNGLQIGDVLAVFQAGRIKNGVRLPEKIAGELIIFRTFEQVSFGLIMRTDGPVRLGDRVVSPG